MHVVPVRCEAGSNSGRLTDGNGIIETSVITLIILAPIFSNYGFISQFSIGDLFVLVSLPWLFSKMGINNLKLISILIASIIVLGSFVLLGGTSVYVGFYRAAFYYLSFFFIISGVNFPCVNFMRIYGYACLAAAGAIILQWVAYFVFGTTLIFQLPLEYYEPDTMKVIDHVFRAGGIFKEPSYFSIYVMPYLLYTASLRKFIPLLIVCVAGVMSTSSLMIFLIVLIIFILSRNSFNKWLAAVIFFLNFLLSAFLFYMFSDEFIFLERVKLIFIDGGTLNERFLPIAEIFDQINFIFPSIDVYDFYRSSSLWFNSAASLVVYFGVIGLLFLIFNLHGFGFLFGAIFLLCIFTTHFMASPFGYFVGISLMIIRGKLLYCGKRIG